MDTSKFTAASARGCVHGRDPLTRGSHPLPTPSSRKSGNHRKHRCCCDYYSVTIIIIITNTIATIAWSRSKSVGAAGATYFKDKDWDRSETTFGLPSSQAHLRSFYRRHVIEALWLGKLSSRSLKLDGLSLSAG